MLIATCPKCGFPFWRGTLEDTPDGDVFCPQCEVSSSLTSSDKYSVNEWREAFLTNEKYTLMRNVFHTSMRGFIEAMDLPGYFVEWSLLTLEDLSTTDVNENRELKKMFQEEVRCMMETIIKKLTKRLTEKTAS